MRGLVLTVSQIEINKARGLSSIVLSWILGEQSLRTHVPAIFKFITIEKSLSIMSLSYKGLLSILLLKWSTLIIIR